jgi:hypothetical protein
MGALTEIQSSAMKLAEQPIPTIHAVDLRLRSAVWANGLLLLAVLVGFSVALARSDWAVNGVWIWAAAGVVATAAVFVQLHQAVRWHATSLVFGPTALRVYRRGLLVEEIPYEAITGYKVNVSSAQEWLSIERNDGAAPLVVVHDPVVRPRHGDTAEVARALAPRIPQTAYQERGERPPGEIDGYLFDCFGDAPEVAMASGTSYRYMAPGELRKDLAFRDASPGGAAVGIALLAINTFRDHNAVTILKVAAVIGGSAAAYAIWVSFRSWKFSKALEDRIEGVPEGLKITRKERTWVVRGPGFGSRCSGSGYEDVPFCATDVASAHTFSTYDFSSAMSDWLTSELPTRRSDRVLVWDRPLANWAMLEAALVIVFLFTVLSLGAWGVLGRSPWTLLAASLAVSGLAVWRLVEHVRWRGTYVVFGHNSVRILRSERLVDEIPYGAISGYTLEPGKEQLLTIERSDGEPPWVAPG